MEERLFIGGAMTNTLYYGNNIDILEKHLPDELDDLIYLDPTFNSKIDFPNSLHSIIGRAPYTWISAQINEVLI